MAEATGSKLRKKVFCDVCSTFVSSDSLLSVHNNGKKHQRLLKARVERQACAERSIYVRGFSTTNSLESDLNDYFSKFGSVSAVYVDKEKAGYAIVEFQSPTEAKTVLDSKDYPLFHGKQLKFKQRYVKELPKGKTKSKCSWNRDKMKSDAAKMSYYLDENVVDRMKNSKTFDDQVATLVSATCLTEEDIRLRKLIVQYLHEIFVEVFPECEVVPFGSSSTELGLNGADLDLCLLVDPVSLENATLEGCEDTSCLNDVTDQLTFIVKLLRQFAAGFQNVVAVVSAKCPLVKFLHRDSGLSCDLSINNRLAIRNTELIKAYAALDDRIRPLAITLKNWGAAKRLTGSGSHQISNYALVLMLLHFLQRTQPPVVPVLQISPENEIFLETDITVPEKILIEGWDCSFVSTTKRDEKTNEESLGDLLKSWFYYYAHTFDYGNEVITIRHGGCKRVLKHDITDNIMSSSDKVNFFKVSPLCVQDPFELSHNLTHSITVEILRRFIQACIDAHSVLTESSKGASTASSSPVVTIQETFLELFTVATGLPEKPKKVVYSFKIPSQLILPEHEESEASVDLLLQKICNFITETLTEDLLVSCELRSSESSPVKCLDRNSDCDRCFDNTADSAQCSKDEEVCQTSGKRAREDDEHAERMDVKKVKTCDQSENSFILVCKASHITWQNRRRQRRLQRQGENIEVDESQSLKISLPNTVANPMMCQVDEMTRCSKSTGETGLDNALQQTSPQNVSWKHTTPSTLDQNRVHSTDKIYQPLLEFMLKIELISDGREVPNQAECNVTLSYLDGSIHHFSNFYAFFKKFVITKLAESRK